MYTHTDTYTRKLHTHRHTETYTCTHRHTHAYTQTHTYIHTHTYTDTQRHTHTHTDTHRHTHTPRTGRRSHDDSDTILYIQGSVDSNASVSCSGLFFPRSSLPSYCKCAGNTMHNKSFWYRRVCKSWSNQGVIANGERCQICDLRRFSSGTRDQDHSRAFL